MIVATLGGCELVGHDSGPLGGVVSWSVMIVTTLGGLCHDSGHPGGGGGGWL